MVSTAFLLTALLSAFANSQDFTCPGVLGDAEFRAVTGEDVYRRLLLTWERSVNYVSCHYAARPEYVHLRNGGGHSDQIIIRVQPNPYCPEEPTPRTHVQLAMPPKDAALRYPFIYSKADSSERYCIQLEPIFGAKGLRNLEGLNVHWISASLLQSIDQRLNGPGQSYLFDSVRLDLKTLHTDLEPAKGIVIDSEFRHSEGMGYDFRVWEDALPFYRGLFHRKGWDLKEHVTGHVAGHPVHHLRARKGKTTLLMHYHPKFSPTEHSGSISRLP